MSTLPEGSSARAWAGSLGNPFGGSPPIVKNAGRIENFGATGTTNGVPIPRIGTASMFGIQRPTSSSLAAVRSGGTNVGRVNYFPAGRQQELENNQPITMTLTAESLPDQSQTLVRQGAYLFINVKQRYTSARYAALSVPALNGLMEESAAGVADNEDEQGPAGGGLIGAGVFVRNAAALQPHLLSAQERFAVHTVDGFSEKWLPLGVVLGAMPRGLERQFELAVRGRAELPPVFFDAVSGKPCVPAVGDKLAWVVVEARHASKENPMGGDYAVRYNTRGESAGSATTVPYMQLCGYNCGEYARPPLNVYVYQSAKPGAAFTLRKAAVDVATGVREFPTRGDAEERERRREGYGTLYRETRPLVISQVYSIGFVRNIEGNSVPPTRSAVLAALRNEDRWAALLSETQIETTLRVG
jgi:hypothetical protein